MKSVFEIKQKTKRKYSVAYLDLSFVFSGAEVSLESLINQLDKERFTPSLWFKFPMIHQERYSIPGIDKNYLSSGRKWWMGSDYWTRPVRGADFLKRLIFSLALAIRLKKNKVDILHINLARYDSFWWVFLARFLGIKVVLHCRSDPISWIPNRIIQSCSNSIISVSDFIRNKVLSKNPSARVSTIYDPVFFQVAPINPEARVDALTQLGFLDGTLLLSSVGLLSPHKGHDMAIRVFCKILSRYPAAKLFIAGGGPNEEKERLKGIAETLCISSSVIFSSGQLDNINTIYQASILVFSLTSRGEAFGRVPFESMANGTPVLAPALGGAAEIIEDGVTGFLVNPLDEIEITKKTFSILENYEMAKYVTLNGRKFFLDLLSPFKSTAKVMDIYEVILQK